MGRMDEIGRRDERAEEDKVYNFWFGSLEYKWLQARFPNPIWGIVNGVNINGGRCYGVLGVECTLVVGLDCEIFTFKELIPSQIFKFTMCIFFSFQIIIPFSNVRPMG